MGKTAFSTFFLGFCAISSDYCPFLPGFAGFNAAVVEEICPKGC
jgi:hypothetical protein